MCRSASCVPPSGHVHASGRARLPDFDRDEMRQNTDELIVDPLRNGYRRWVIELGESLVQVPMIEIVFEKGAQGRGDVGIIHDHAAFRTFGVQRISLHGHGATERVSVKTLALPV